MKFTDYLKKAFGIDTDTEVNEDGTPIQPNGTEEAKKTDEEILDSGGGVSNAVVSGDNKDTKQAGTEDKKSEAVIETAAATDNAANDFETGWFNKETGAIDISKVHNADVLDAINMLQEKATVSNLNSQVETEIDNFMAANNMTITKESFKKLIDLSGAKLGEDGQVTGVKEALDSFKASEPSLFNTAKETEKTPLEEGLSPTDPVGAEEPSWAAAYDTAIVNV